MSRTDSLLLRFIELEACRARNEITDEGEAEVFAILAELGLPREKVIEKAKEVVVGNYDSK